MRGTSSGMDVGTTTRYLSAGSLSTPSRLSMRPRSITISESSGSSAPGSRRTTRLGPVSEHSKRTRDKPVHPLRRAKSGSRTLPRCRPSSFSSRDRSPARCSSSAESVRRAGRFSVRSTSRRESLPNSERCSSRRCVAVGIGGRTLLPRWRYLHGKSSSQSSEPRSSRPAVSMPIPSSADSSSRSLSSASGGWRNHATFSSPPSTGSRRIATRFKGQASGPVRRQGIPHHPGIVQRS